MLHIKLPSLAVTALLIFSGATPAETAVPDGVRMTWFGVTNWYYEIGGTGILVDGAVSKFNDEGARSDAGLVERVYRALDRGAGIDKIFIGHEHDDHSFDAVAWAKVTGADIYTSAVACQSAVSKGLPASQCKPVFGGEVIDIDGKTKARVVRWAHSLGCDATSKGGTAGIETFAFLFTSELSSGKLAWFISDTGAGGAELVTSRVVNGKDFGAPLTNLGNAVKDAGLDGFDLWQGGPESRVVNQARVLAPVFKIKTFIPQHYGARGGYDILSGLHYAYDPADHPKLQSVLKEFSVESLVSTNYFDAYSYTQAGVKRIANSAVKAAVGLPAEGPGPKAQAVNPRAGQLECETD